MGSTLQVVANSRTPSSVVLDLANDGNVDGAAITMLTATLLGQLLPGPLYTLIARNDGALTALNANRELGNKIRFTEIAGGLDALLIPPNATLYLAFTAGGLEYSLFNNTPGVTPSRVLIELRATHSNER